MAWNREMQGGMLLDKTNIYFSSKLISERPIAIKSVKPTEIKMWNFGVCLGPGNMPFIYLPIPLIAPSIHGWKEKAFLL